MEKLTRIALLYDFYGNLLTDKQKHSIEMYCNHDLSLGEIAEELHISRQAVHDNLKRAEKALETYEEKLGLVAKFIVERNKLSNVANLLENFKKTGQEKYIERITGIINEILELENN